MILRFNGLPVVLESPLQPLARIRVLEISMASMILDSLTKQRSVTAEGDTIGVFEGGKLHLLFDRSGLILLF